MFKNVLTKFHISFKEDSREFQATRVFQGCFKGVSSVFQVCFKGLSRVFQGCFKGVSRKFHGSFKEV